MRYAQQSHSSRDGRRLSGSYIRTIRIVKLLYYRRNGFCRSYRTLWPVSQDWAARIQLDMQLLRYAAHSNLTRQHACTCVWIARIRMQFVFQMHNNSFSSTHLYSRAIFKLHFFVSESSRHSAISRATTEIQMYIIVGPENTFAVHHKQALKQLCHSLRIIFGCKTILCDCHSVGRFSFSRGISINVIVRQKNRRQYIS